MVRAEAVNDTPEPRTGRRRLRRLGAVVLAGGVIYGAVVGIKSASDSHYRDELAQDTNTIAGMSTAGRYEHDYLGYNALDTHDGQSCLEDTGYDIIASRYTAAPAVLTVSPQNGEITITPNGNAADALHFDPTFGNTTHALEPADRATVATLVGYGCIAGGQYGSIQ